MDLANLQITASQTDQVHYSSENTTQQPRKGVPSTAAKDGATKAMNPISITVLSNDLTDTFYYYNQG